MALFEQPSTKYFRISISRRDGDCSQDDGPVSGASTDGTALGVWLKVDGAIRDMMRSVGIIRSPSCTTRNDCAMTSAEICSDSIPSTAVMERYPRRCTSS